MTPTTTADTYQPNEVADLIIENWGDWETVAEALTKLEGWSQIVTATYGPTGVSVIYAAGYDAVAFRIIETNSTIEAERVGKNPLLDAIAENAQRVADYILLSMS